MMKEIIPRHVTLKATSVAYFTGTSEKLDGFLVKIYEGDHIMTRENVKLAEITCFLSRARQERGDKSGQQLSSLKPVDQTFARLMIEIVVLSNGDLSIISKTNEGNVVKHKIAYSTGIVLQLYLAVK